MSSVLNQLTSKDTLKMFESFEAPFKNLPHLPEDVKEFLAKLGPWAAALNVVLGIWLILNSLQNVISPPEDIILLGTVIPALRTSPVYEVTAIILWAIIVYLAANAFKPLQDRKIEGWMYLFWIFIISIVFTLAGVLTGYNVVGAVMSAIIGGALGCYFMFEMKSKYTGVVSEAKEKLEEKK